MNDAFRDMAAAVAGDVLLWILGLIGLAVLGLLLRFRPVRRVRNWGLQTFNIPRVELELRYEISLDNWVPQTDLAETPPSRDTLVWALDKDGGPYTSKGCSYHRVTVTAAKPVNFEVREVTISYVREPHEQGTTYFAVPDGLGDAGMIEPAYFRVQGGLTPGSRARTSVPSGSLPPFGPTNRRKSSRPTVSARQSNSTSIYTFRRSRRGCTTYTVKARILVNGIERVFMFDRAEYANRAHLLCSAYFLNPAQMHEEFVQAPWATRWLPGPHPPYPQMP